MPPGVESGFTSAVSEDELAPIFQTSQWVTSVDDFIGAPSGSCITRAKLIAPAGGLLQLNAGEVALGSGHQNCVGLLSPVSKVLAAIRARRTALIVSIPASRLGTVCVSGNLSPGNARVMLTRYGRHRSVWQNIWPKEGESMELRKPAAGGVSFSLALIAMLQFSFFGPAVGNMNAADNSNKTDR